MCLSDDARILLLDIGSSKDSHSARLFLESDVSLLISGEASDPSTLGYDGKPSQENVTFTEKEQRLSTHSFRPHDEPSSQHESLA